MLRQKESVSAVAISPNGRTLATACTDGTVKLWNLATHKRWPPWNLEVSISRVSPDSRTLAAFEWDYSSTWRAPDSSSERTSGCITCLRQLPLNNAASARCQEAKMKRTIKRFDDDAAKPLKRVNPAAQAPD
jgi:WD40 repeat protein